MFDIIIIGAGSAGCTLAAKLNSHYKIALIEAGGSNLQPQVRIPLGMAITVPYSVPQNWHFFTTPQVHLHNRCGYQPRGRGLGGSSSINAMVYIRGQPEDYDGWARQGCIGWAWQDVFPYFIQVEKNEVFHNGWHGNEGELNVSASRSHNIFSQAFIEAGIESGFIPNEDFNGACQEGVGWYQLNQLNGERCDTARAFLFDKPHPNIEIITKASVQRILFDKVDGRLRAVGVEVLRQGKVEVILAEKEIVLCAGAFGSPQILMISGIGPAKQLRELGITVIHHAPEVGENLQDHIGFTLTRKIPFPEAIHLIGVSLRGLVHLGNQVKLYYKDRQGLLTSNVAEAGAFLRSQPQAATPDIQLHFMIALLRNHRLLYRYMHGYSCHVCILHPKSRGRVYLRSRDPHQGPLIDPNFLSHPEDLSTLVRGVKITQTIFEQPALKKFKGSIIEEKDNFNTDAEIIEAIRNKADTIYHPVGTCRMGSDTNAVVDTTLRVNGVEGLRVVDASIMPKIISGNTNTPTIMIACRAAEFINKAN